MTSERSRRRLSLSDFSAPFLLPSSATSRWAARSDWCLPSASRSGSTTVPSRPNLSALRRYAGHIVPVADTTQREYSDFRRSERPLGDVLDLWEAGGGEGLYVKDWHLLAELEAGGLGVGEVYEVPECFREDWLNPPYIPDPRTPPSPSSPSSPTPCSTSARAAAHHADFRFAYLGPAGTFTPLHRDVYASCSWSANVVGRKVWWLFPPATDTGARAGAVDRLRGKDGQLVFDVRDIAGGEDGAIKIVQQEGEVIFVPSGWYHQVVNLDFCISINHNFFSPLTLPRVYAALVSAQETVEESIADVKAMIQDRHGHAQERAEPGGGPERQAPVPAWEAEWVGEVQTLLAMDAGWGWAGFWGCVRHNVQHPPADPSLSVPRAQRDRYVRDVIGLYAARREWTVLRDVRGIIDDIERALALGDGDGDEISQQGRSVGKDDKM